MTVRILKTVIFGCGILVCLATGSMAEVEGAQTVDPAQVEQLQERMANDPEMMELIMSLQSDPDMQEILSDPAIAAKIQAGDLDSLANDPRMIKLLKKDQVKELEKRLR